MSGIYKEINGVIRPVKQAYVGVNGVARKVFGGYIGVNDKARIFWDETVLPVPTAQTLTLPWGAGNQRQPYWIGYDENLMTMGGTISAEERGTYTTTFEIINKDKYIFENRSFFASVTWQIVKAHVGFEIRRYATMNVGKEGICTINMWAEGSRAWALDTNRLSIRAQVQNTGIAVINRTQRLDPAFVTYLNGVSAGITYLNVSVYESENNYAHAEDVMVKVL